MGVLRILLVHITSLLMMARVTAQPAGDSVETFTGAELNLGNYIRIPELFGHDKKGYYAHTFDYRDGIEFLDTGFHSVKHEYLDLTNGLRERTLLALVYFHDSIYMFTSEERFKRMLLYVETIDKETLLQNGDERLVMDVENLSGWMSDFGLQLSRQEKKLLVFSRLDVLSKKMQDLHFIVFGEGLSVEWEADQRIMYSDRRPRESIIKVNEEGDVFIMSLLDDQKLKSLWNETKNRYHLVAVTEKGKYNHTYYIDFPNLYIRGIQIEPGPDHSLSCVGFHSPTYFRGMINGMFYMKLDNAAARFTIERFYEFEPWFLTEAIAHNPKKEPEEMFDFRVRQLIKRNNGNFIFLAENEFDQTYDTYQNVIAACFSPAGNLEWARVVQKRQGIDQNNPVNYSSYSVQAPWYTDKIFLVFNDDNSNGQWPSEDRIKSFHPNDRANLKIVGIGPSGELSSQIIYSKTRKRMKTPVPLGYYDMLNNEMVIPMLRYKKYNYMKIGFSE
jgi:hypothetical protein